ncbi:MAG TPA: cob(I)yrinic acid a,c-diamide adenosyltransferase [bacterium]|mgnify:CR=1 FL=1|nr:cob(I)yrinic acid a,c-diamide adenosyltransferase [bacterium]
MSTPQNNLIIFYTGSGKGKTTAALGLALRALREKMKVLLVQFIKSATKSGEVSLKNILPNLEIKCFGAGFVTFAECHPEQKPSGARLKPKDPVCLKPHKVQAQRGLSFAKNLLKSKKYDVIILDEIFVASHLKLISKTDIIDLIALARKSKKTFLVLTGRGCPKSLYKFADLITEMTEIKHPFKKGTQAIKGIDY